MLSLVDYNGVRDVVGAHPVSSNVINDMSRTSVVELAYENKLTEYVW